MILSTTYIQALIHKKYTYRHKESVTALISIHPEVFCEKVLLKNISKFTGKHL